MGITKESCLLFLLNYFGLNALRCKDAGFREACTCRKWLSTFNDEYLDQTNRPTCEK